jgi:hypothetical protein
MGIVIILVIVFNLCEKYLRFWNVSMIIMFGFILREKDGIILIFLEEFGRNG